LRKGTELERVAASLVVSVDLSGPTSRVGTLSSAVWLLTAVLRRRRP
jgi:hypothetical protein